MSESRFRALSSKALYYLDYLPLASTTIPLIREIRDALDTPPPKPPTDEELDEVWDEEASYFNLYEEARRFARAVLERWG